MLGNGSDVRQLVSTVTLEASGSQTVEVCKENVPFDHLSISIVPLDSVASGYDVDVLFGEQVFETKSYPEASGVTVCLLSYPDHIFPATLNSKRNPHTMGVQSEGVKVQVKITSTESVDSVFKVYTCYRMLHSAVLT